VDWQDKMTVKKGNIGEAIVHSYLESLGYIVYKPITDGGHPFDRLAVKDREKIIIAEVKTKAHRNLYPDTGINVKHYNEYKAVSEKYGIRVFLFFVDEMNGKVYGNFLDELEKPQAVTHSGRKLYYPLRQKDIIYFPLKSMIVVGHLTEQQIKILREYSTRNYEYWEQ